MFSTTGINYVSLFWTGVEDATAILEENEQMYPRSALFLFFKGRVQRVKVSIVSVSAHWPLWNTICILKMPLSNIFLWLIARILPLEMHLDILLRNFFMISQTLDQVMAWCLKAPSHYLNHCWLRRYLPQWVNDSFFGVIFFFFFF